MNRTYLTIEEFNIGIARCQRNPQAVAAARATITEGMSRKEAAERFVCSVTEVSRVLIRAEEEYLKANELRRVTIFVAETELPQVRSLAAGSGGRVIDIAENDLYSNQNKRYLYDRKKAGGKGNIMTSSKYLTGL